MVSRWSGARKHMARQHPALAEVMQRVEAHPTLAPVFTDFARKNVEIIKKNGAQPVLFMSWAYADKPEMTEQLAAAFGAVSPT